MKDLRTDHNPILPGVMSERAVRSTLNMITRAMRRTKSAALLLKLRNEQKDLQVQLRMVIEARREALQTRLAELESGEQK